MGFYIEFRPGTPSADGPGVDPENDYETLVMEVCEALEKRDGSQFTLVGFGREPWPVDVGYDMSVVLEQLPDLLESLERSDTFRLDMYSQGIEAALDFVTDGRHVAVVCSSRTSWTPHPSREIVERTALVDMLNRFATEFARAAVSVEPGLTSVELFDRWIDQTEHGTLTWSQSSGGMRA